jgi:ERF superfamily
MQKLFTALAVFRQKVSAVKKDADNPFFKSKYADLPSILEVIKQPLEDSGLAITHYCKTTE